MDKLLELNGIINEFVWGPPMLILLVGTGIYLTLRTNFFSITNFDLILHSLSLKIHRFSDKIILFT